MATSNNTPAPTKPLMAGCQQEPCSAVAPELTYLIDEAIQSMEAGQGLRCGMYIRAAHDWIHGKKSTELEVCMDGFLPPNVNVDLPDTAAQDSAPKSNNPAVSG